MPAEDLLYHTAPLHYLPCILKDQALYAQSVLVKTGIEPRLGAKRRLRMLGLTDYVYFSLCAHTPLLADKIAKGYPHVLLVFRRTDILAMPHAALLPYNTKSWQTRAEFIPVTDPTAQERLLCLYRQQGHAPSLAALVKYGVPLSNLLRVVFLSAEERAMTERLLQRLGIPSPASFTVDAPQNFSPMRSADHIAAINLYFDRCVEAGVLLHPPDLPYD